MSAFSVANVPLGSAVFLGETRFDFCLFKEAKPRLPGQSTHWWCDRNQVAGAGILGLASRNAGLWVVDAPKWRCQSRSPI